MEASSHTIAALIYLALTSRIIIAYQTAYGTIPSTIDNPVMKISIVAQGFGDQLLITELMSEEDGGLAEGMLGVHEKWGQLEYLAARLRYVVMSPLPPYSLIS